MDQDYPLFVRIVESGSISAAARALRLSPAMVSKRLARLEARLGTRLAHRTTRRLVTTEAGQRFYDDIVRILAAASEAEARVAGHGAPAGRLRVTAPTSFGRLHIAPYIKAFLDAHPRIALELELSDGFTDLIGGRFDMAIRIGAATEGNLVAHRLAANRRILCAAPAYLAEAGTPLTLADLAHHRLLAAENQLPWRIEGPDGLSVIGGDSAVRTNSSEVVRELAISGFGIALRSTWDIAEELRSGRLLRVLPAHEGASDVSIQAVYPRAELTPAPVLLFAQWLEGVFAPVPPWEQVASKSLQSGEGASSGFMGKLSGIKVVDLSQFLPGPMLSVMMADHGAEVVKVEPPGGDPARDQAPFEAGQSIWFRNLNRGKKSVVLDLKSDAGRDALWALIDDADVFLEGFRPGVMARLGFGYDAVAARNPRIVYCSISAFGQTGALAHHAAHDMAVQAMAGFLSVNDGPDGTPVVPGAAAADMAAGLTGLSAVLMALIGREKTGKGDYVDIAMFDSLLPWCVHTAGAAIGGGEPPRSASQRSLGGAAFYNVYETADRRHVVLGGRELKFVANLLDALGRPDLAPLGVDAPGDAQAPLIAFLRETFRTRTRDAWVEWFADKDVAFSPVLDFREAFAAPHIAERGLVVEVDGAHQIAPPIRFAGESRWKPQAAPELGADG